MKEKILFGNSFKRPDKYLRFSSFKLQLLIIINFNLIFYEGVQLMIKLKN